ncbi:hypothetical protein T484DRAFT_1852832 [Baffinella frigidus]|nr:hypothetical protein T484DRAFT_1852832 [Cryptophyta sp. CCMP2293]
MAGVRTARWGALLPVLLLLAVACASPAVADTTSGAGDDAGEPWRREANQDRDAELRGRLSALDNAREAEAEAAAREKSIGGEKLEEATKASKQAAAFMTKAEKLLASEDNLKDEESNVKERLDVLERGHHNLKRWNSCDAGDAGCTADQKDVWGPSAPEGAESDGRISSVLKSRKKKRKRTEAAPAPPAVFDPSPRGRPYSGKVWQDAKPVVEWATVKTSALRAGYELSNCFVAAEKDPSTVQVEIMDQRTFIVTKEGCAPRNAPSI